MTRSKKSRFCRLDRFAATVAGAITLALLAMAIWAPTSAEAPEAVQFLGRFHPILVHLPIGFLAALLVLEAFDLFIRSAVLHHATYIMAWLAAGAALLAVIAGLLLAYPGGYSGELMFWHRWLGILTAVCAVWILAWKVCRPLHESHGWSFAYHPLLLCATALLAGAGHYGGSITHGSDYLTAYMPKSLRPLFGLEDPLPGAAPTLPDDPREAVVFTTLVEPILKTNCVSCHGPEKQKGDLRIDSHPLLLEGGESGPDLGLIAKVLQLPVEDEAHMPPKNKPQLTSDEIALITWWIQTGASETAQVREIPATRQINRILQEKLHLEPDEEEVPMKEWEEIETIVQNLRAELGISVNRIARGTSALEVPFIPVDANFGDDELGRLEPLGSNFQFLNLSRSAITDDGLAHVASMKNLVRLDLSNTAISDAGIAHLSGLSRLEYLNLYGTKITDEALKRLQSLASLKKVYLWHTEVTKEAVAQLQQGLLDEAQMESWRAEIRQLQQRLESSRVEVDLGKVFEPVPVEAPETEAAEAEEPVEAPETQIAAAGPINEECPVSGKAIDPTKTATHGDTVIAFCCGKCLAKFEENPAPILASLNLDGEEPEATETATAAAGPINEECPVSGKAVDPTKTAIHGDTVIAFCCGKCLAKFEENPAPILEKLNL